ncbi:MAG: hypothetical protein WCS42_08725 [Verrucomicrobiota bacterium]
MKILLLALLTLTTIASAQIVVTNTTVVTGKVISGPALTNIVAGVNAMQISPASLTVDALRSASVVPVGNRYRISVSAMPTVLLTTNISDSGMETTIRTVISTRITPVLLEADQMGAIFALAVGDVGNMEPPLTLTNFASMFLARETNGVWKVTARMK